MLVTRSYSGVLIVGGGMIYFYYGRMSDFPMHTVKAVICMYAQYDVCWPRGLQLIYSFEMGRALVLELYLPLSLQVQLVREFRYL